MIHSLEGTVTHRSAHFLVVDVHGVGFKVAMSTGAIAGFVQGDTVKVFTHLHTSDASLDLYGFPDPDMLQLFEQLIGVSGVGPKGALAILDAINVQDLAGAVEGNRPDLIAKAPGVGRKTAERIIIELRGKLAGFAESDSVQRMDADGDLIDALVSLGYRREDARNAVRSIKGEVTGLEARLKKALAFLGNKKV